MITPSDLKKLRDSLPSNYAELLETKLEKKLGKEKGLSKSTIYSVMNGVRHNSVIIDAAIELARETKEKLESQKEAIENL